MLTRHQLTVPARVAQILLSGKFHPTLIKILTNGNTSCCSLPMGSKLTSYLDRHFSPLRPMVKDLELLFLNVNTSGF